MSRTSSFPLVQLKPIFEYFPAPEDRRAIERHGALHSQFAKWRKCQLFEPFSWESPKKETEEARTGTARLMKVRSSYSMIPTTQGPDTSVDPVWSLRCTWVFSCSRLYLRDSCIDGRQKSGKHTEHDVPAHNGQSIRRRQPRYFLWLGTFLNWTGNVCKWQEVDYYTGCCASSGPGLGHCSETCCSEYAHCVSRCMKQPDVCVMV